MLPAWCGFWCYEVGFPYKMGLSRAVGLAGAPVGGANWYSCRQGKSVLLLVGKASAPVGRAVITFRSHALLSSER